LMLALSVSLILCFKDKVDVSAYPC
jgi:hypothetical protein